MTNSGRQRVNVEHNIVLEQSKRCIERILITFCMGSYAVCRVCHCAV